MKRAICLSVGRATAAKGTSSKTVLTDGGEIEIAVPRDSAGSFEPQLIAKGQTRFSGFDEKILSLYARGMTVREIQGHLAELYATDVSPDLISRVTDAVLGEVREWQNRPLDPVYPVVFFDVWRRQDLHPRGRPGRTHPHRRNPHCRALNRYPTLLPQTFNRGTPRASMRIIPGCWASEGLGASPTCSA
jgi:hypothetical protein